ncbi:MAG: MerR family transcriptional regulator [Bacteroidia bacterium]|jgi:DNA-binding transcriptional MerR regulator
MEEIPKTLYTIGEVAEMIGEAPSLIRFWEKEFPRLKPLKSEKGTRKYTQSDLQMLKLIHHLVKRKGMTLEGARQYLKKQHDTDQQAELLEKLENVKRFLVELKQGLK